MHNKEKVIADMESYVAAARSSAALNPHEQKFRDFLKRLWKNTPVNLGLIVNTPSMEWAPSVSADGLKLFFSGYRSEEHGDLDIWITTRATTEDHWTEPVNLGPNINTFAWDRSMSITADGSLIYFISNRDGGVGGRDIWELRIPALQE